MNYEELAALVNSMPRIPRHELKCHPSVVVALREESWWKSSSRSRLGNLYDLLTCPVYEYSSMEPGAWEIYEDDVLVDSGVLG